MTIKHNHVPKDLNEVRLNRREDFLVLTLLLVKAIVVVGWYSIKIYLYKVVVMSVCPEGLEYGGSNAPKPYYAIGNDTNTKLIRF